MARRKPFLFHLSHALYEAAVLVFMFACLIPLHVALLILLRVTAGELLERLGRRFSIVHSALH